MNDLVPLDFLVVGNGATIHAFDWDKLDHNIRVIAMNGAWMELINKVDIDYVVASDEHWVTHNKEHCPRPCYTKDVWGSKHSQHTVPGSDLRDVTGPLAIKLALTFTPRYVHCIGFDTITHDSTERWHEHELKIGSIKNTQRFKEQYHNLLAHSKPSVLQCLSSQKEWQKWLYK